MHDFNANTNFQFAQNFAHITLAKVGGKTVKALSIGHVAFAIYH